MRGAGGGSSASAEQVEREDEDDCPLVSDLLSSSLTAIGAELLQTAAGSRGQVCLDFSSLASVFLFDTSFRMYIDVVNLANRIANPKCQIRNTQPTSPPGLTLSWFEAR
jgi:hypothetical protein